MDSTVLDKVADRLTVQINTVGRPRCSDVLIWAETWAESLDMDGMLDEAEIGRWFINEFLPVARAATGGAK